MRTEAEQNQLSNAKSKSAKAAADGLQAALDGEHSEHAADAEAMNDDEQKAGAPVSGKKRKRAEAELESEHDFADPSNGSHTKRNSSNSKQYARSPKHVKTKPASHLAEDPEDVAMVQLLLPLACDLIVDISERRRAIAIVSRVLVVELDASGRGIQLLGKLSWMLLFSHSSLSLTPKRCSACTLINDADGADSCTACGTLRPQQPGSSVDAAARPRSSASSSSSSSSSAFVDARSMQFEDGAPGSGFASASSLLHKGGFDDEDEVQHLAKAPSQKPKPKAKSKSTLGKKPAVHSLFDLSLSDADASSSSSSAAFRPASFFMDTDEQDADVVVEPFSGFNSAPSQKQPPPASSSSTTRAINVKKCSAKGKENTATWNAGAANVMTAWLAGAGKP